MTTQTTHNYFTWLYVLLVSLGALAACGEEMNDDEPNGASGEPAEPTATLEDDPSNFGYELVATEKNVPPETAPAVIDLAESEAEYLELWDKYRLEDDPPAVDWTQRLVVFIATGESGTCPLEIVGVRYNQAERLLTVEVSPGVPDQPCTDDWTPRTFVIGVGADAVAGGELSVSLRHDEGGPGELGREQVRP